MLPDPQHRGVEDMRKPIVVLAILILAIFGTAGRAGADTTTYAISGNYGAGSSTALSNPGDAFSFTFGADPATLTGSPSVSLATPPNVAITYTDTTASISQSLTGTITFQSFSAGLGGLLDIDFTFSGDAFILQLSSLTNQQLYAVNGGIISLPSTPPGGFPIESDPGDCSVSFLGDGVTGNCTAIASGTVTGTSAAVPEPSSLLLLASSLLGMTVFARRRLA
jgi:hypothetical protein